MYEWKYDAYENLKSSLTHNHPLLINSRGSFVEPFLAITRGELEPQFASKGSYFEQNIKQVCRCNGEVKKYTLASYLIYIIIHVPSEKIWNHLGQFGGLDIKTS